MLRHQTWPFGCGGNDDDGSFQHLHPFSCFDDLALRRHGDGDGGGDGVDDAGPCLPCHHHHPGVCETWTLDAAPDLGLGLGLESGRSGAYDDVCLSSQS
jgi:hypothetical protein